MLIPVYCWNMASKSRNFFIAICICIHSETQLISPKRKDMNSQCSASTMLSEAPPNKLKITLPIIAFLSVVTMNMFWLFMTHYLCFGCLWHYKKIVFCFFSYLNPSRRLFFPHSLKESLLIGRKPFHYKSTTIRNWDIQSLNLLLEITSQTLCFQYEEQPRNCSANVQKD